MADYTVTADYDECEANAVCVGYAPEVFNVDDDDNLWILQEHPDEAIIDKVRLAVDSCPKRALFLKKGEETQ